MSKNEKDLYCYAFEDIALKKIYFGGAWMKGYDILFDKSNSQIHFVESECDPNSVENNGIGNPNIISTQDDLNLIIKINALYKGCNK